MMGMKETKEMKEVMRQVWGVKTRLVRWYADLCERWQAGLCTMVMRGDRCLRDARGQGTTEYAILVGVLVVIAIIAVVAFRDKLQDLWTNISDGVNNL